MDSAWRPFDRRGQGALYWWMVGRRRQRSGRKGTQPDILTDPGYVQGRLANGWQRVNGGTALRAWSFGGRASLSEGQVAGFIGVPASPGGPWCSSPDPLLACPIQNKRSP